MDTDMPGMKDSLQITWPYFSNNFFLKKKEKFPIIFGSRLLLLFPSFYQSLRLSSISLSTLY